MLFPVLDSFMERYDNKYVHFKCEPGRYLVAECGLLLGTVHAVKENYGEAYVGTDIGFNVLMRPVLYDSYHEVKLLRNSDETRKGADEKASPATIVGNICESGDILAAKRLLGTRVKMTLSRSRTPARTVTQWPRTITAACAPPRC